MRTETLREDIKNRIAKILYGTVCPGESDGESIEWLYNLVKDDVHTYIQRRPYDYHLYEVYITFCIDDRWYWTTAKEKFVLGAESNTEFAIEPELKFEEQEIIEFPPVGYIKSVSWGMPTTYVECYFVGEKHFATGNTYNANELKKILDD